MRFILTLLLIFILFISSASVPAAYAQVFKFSLANPATPAAQTGNNFDVKILINTNGQKTLGGDAIVVYDPNFLTINPPAVKGTFFDVFQDHTIGGTTNKYLLSAWQTTDVNPVSTANDSLFGTVTFNAKSSGNTTLSFDCTTGTTDSNIWDTNQNDIINCANMQPLALNIGGPGPTSTPAATMTPAPTSTPSATPIVPTSTTAPTNTPRPTISILPRTGSTEVTFAALGLGAILTLVGILVIL